MENTISSHHRTSSRAWTRLGLATLLVIAGARPLVAADAPAPVELSAKRAIQVSFSTKQGERYQVFRSVDGMSWIPRCV